VADQVNDESEVASLGRQLFWVAGRRWRILNSKSRGSGVSRLQPPRILRMGLWL